MCRWNETKYMSPFKIFYLNIDGKIQDKCEIKIHISNWGLCEPITHSNHIKQFQFQIDKQHYKRRSNG